MFMVEFATGRGRMYYRRAGAIMAAVAEVVDGRHLTPGLLGMLAVLGRRGILRVHDESRRLLG